MDKAVKYALAAWHFYQVAAPYVIASLIPSLVTGLSAFPNTGGAVKVLKKVADFLSWTTHLNSPGTLKLPGTFSPPPAAPAKDAE